MMVKKLRLLLVLTGFTALFACDDDPTEQPNADTGADISASSDTDVGGVPDADAEADAAPDSGYEQQPPAPFEALGTTVPTADGTMATAGVQENCTDFFRDPSTIDGIDSDWELTYVDVNAGLGGLGTPDRPKRTIASALQNAPREGGVVVVLGPGEHEVPTILPRGEKLSLAIVGSCAEWTTLITRADREPVIALPELQNFVMAHVGVRGGRRGLSIDEAEGVYLKAVDIRLAQEEGIFFDSIEGALIEKSTLGESLTNLLVHDSALTLSEVLVDGGGPIEQDSEMNLQACDEERSVVCPYSGLLHVRNSLVRSARPTGIRSIHGMLRLAGTNIEGASGLAANDGIGLEIIESFAVLTNTTVRGTSGVGIVARSARLGGAGVVVDANSMGGLRTERLAPSDDDLLPAGWSDATGTVLPGSNWYPAPDWPSTDADLPGTNWLPNSAFNRGAAWPDAPVDWMPAAEWFGADPASLPAGLQRDATTAVDDLGLHLWARAQIDDLVATGNGEFGVALSGHAARLVSPRIEGTLGASSAGLYIVSALVPIQQAGFETVALSELETPTLSGNQGRGLVLEDVAIFDFVAAAPTPIPALRMVLTGGTIADNGGAGVASFRSALDVDGSVVSANAGLGIWSYRGVLRVANGQITGTTSATHTGRATDVTIGDGLVFESGDTFGSGPDELSITGTTISDAPRTGLLLVGDMAPLSGSVDFSAGSFASNLRDAAAIGDVSGITATNVTIDALSITEAAPPFP